MPSLFCNIPEGKFRCENIQGGALRGIASPFFDGMPIGNRRNTKKYNNALKNEREMHDDWTKKHSKICIYQKKAVILQQKNR